MGWREDQRQARRLDQAAAAEQARRDAEAAVKVEALQARSRLDLQRERAAAKAEERRRAEREKDARTAKRRTRVRAAWRGLGGWLGAHVVDLLIYPLAVVSAVMAIPAMAGWGHDLYGDATGVALPAITELGMWAFAIAVQVSQHRFPQRPVWALQLGVWVFSGFAAGTNALHGFQKGGLFGGIVMGLVSVAGVIAHQLLSASPRRSRAERDLARAARRARRKLALVRRAAVRAAVAQIDGAGHARLVFTPGFYRLTPAWRRWFTKASALKQEATEHTLDWELAALLSDSAAVLDSHPGRSSSGLDSTWSSGGVDTLDPPPDRQPGPDANPRPESRPETGRDQRGSGSIGKRRSTQRRQSESTGSGQGSGHRSTGRSARSIEELRTELARLLAADPDSIDVRSAESIRRALKCRPQAARDLRDEYRRK